MSTAHSAELASELRMETTSDNPSGKRLEGAADKSPAKARTSASRTPRAARARGEVDPGAVHGPETVAPELAEADPNDGPATPPAPPTPRKSARSAPAEPASAATSEIAPVARAGAAGPAGAATMPPVEAPAEPSVTAPAPARAPGPPKVTGITLEVYQALLWLARLLQFRLTAQQEGPLDPGLGLPDLVEELTESCGEAQISTSGPPPLSDTGWLPTLCNLFGLSATDGLLVAAAVAPTVDGRFAQAFGRFSNSSRPERPTTDLLARLLAFTLPERTRLAGMLRAGGPLERFGLLQLDFSDTAALPLNFQPLNVSDRLRWYLLEDARELPPSLQRMFTLRAPRQSLAQVPLDERLKEKLSPMIADLSRFRAQNQPMPVVVLEGPWGVGQVEIAEAMAQHLSMSVLELNLAPWLLTLEPALLPMILRREALLQNAVLLLRAQSDEQGQELLQLRVKQLLDLELEGIPSPILACGNLATLAGLRDLNRPLYRFELRLPDRSVQRRALTVALVQEELTTSEEALESLLNRYNLDLTSTREVIRTAHALARSSRALSGRLETPELELAVEMILRRHLGELSQRLSARYSWEDLILSEEIVSQLKTLKHLIEHKHLVFDTWGLGRKSGGGNGIKALFSGPSGTGKTMSAEVIASDLRLPLYRVDLSAVVSKWVGETEKNLEKIFREAQGSQAILLFDEADALFGKRGKVDNANDRHANLEVSFLLQRFEVHDGVVILTTNFPTVIDTAFARRMQFVIEYEAPDEPTRRQLWKKQLVPTLPQQKDIDIGWLAQRFEISGANIRNVVMASAFLAAAENCAVGMRQIARAMQWEYQKLGRTVSSSDFGRFFR